MKIIAESKTLNKTLSFTAEVKSGFVKSQYKIND